MNPMESMMQWLDDGLVYGKSVLNFFLHPVEIPLCVALALGFAGGFLALFMHKRQKEIRWIQKEHESMDIQLKTLEQAQNHLFLNISHEIRTPLNSIVGFCDLIQARLLRSEMTLSHQITTEKVSSSLQGSSDHKSGLDETMTLIRSLQGYMKPIAEGGSQLLAVIDRLSEVSHVAAGGYALPEKTEDPKNAPSLDLVHMVQGILERLKSEVDKKKLHVQYTAEGDSVLMCQADLLHQALYQVIDNAIKFTPAYGRIQISTFTKSGKGTIRVRDTGRGIPKTHMPFVRHPMGMPADVAIEGRGIGVGLSMADQLMRRLKGSLNLLPLEGKGTEVTLTFPISS
jgi:signal transduction histidine kinase